MELAALLFFLLGAPVSRSERSSGSAKEEEGEEGEVMKESRDDQLDGNTPRLLGSISHSPT